MASFDDPFGGLEGKDRDAALALTNLFASFGLASLAPKILEFIREGYGQDTISLLLQETSEYKARFSANETRRRKGLPVLNPAEYLSTESAYRQIMTGAGLPIGFYDSNDDFTKFLENDLSPTELRGRVEVAQQALYYSDPNTLAYFRQHYTDGEIVAYALDAGRALPLIERNFRAAQIGGAAANQGARISEATVESLATFGVTREQAQAGLGVVAGEQDVVQRLSQIYHEPVITADDLAQEVFRGDAGVTERRRRLASQERATFAGSSGQSKSSLTRTGAGQL